MVLKAGLERRDIDAFGIGGGSQIFRLASPAFGKAIADTECCPLVVVVQMRQRTRMGEFFAYDFSFTAGNNVFVANQGMEIVGVPLAVVWQQIHVLFLSLFEINISSYARTCARTVQRFGFHQIGAADMRVETAVHFGSDFGVLR